ncbi:uncharacterized protein LOC110020475 [Phalaenopsis equestris]|uniref:uncharacterized protein LOC110020475 n=1 Tax=Phalaenopsis equestris TaxID=78828 RepID=UPI0009E18D37|nr:uncharacterized protein LOC110020475 [Phalaenopsis equestris]
MAPPLFWSSPCRLSQHGYPFPAELPLSLLALVRTSISATPGPKEWLRDQKKKAARFVLAPIDASRQSLRNAYQAIDLKSPVMVAGELRKLLNSAARDCVPQDRNSFVAFQARTGVEVCTFALIVKNAASLLDDGDPVKLEAVTRLDDLIRSFSFLGGIIDDSDLGVTSDREKVKIGLLQSISALDNFEQDIGM